MQPPVVRRRSFCLRCYKSEYPARTRPSHITHT